MICSLSKCPVDFQRWSPSSFLIRILFIFLHEHSSVSSFSSLPLKFSPILPEIMHVHAGFPALYLPLLSHSITHQVFTPLAFVKHTVRDRRWRVLVVVFVPAHDNPLPSCPLQASVRFHRLTSCRGESGSQRGWCVGGPCFRLEDQRLIGHSLKLWPKSCLSLLCADQRTDKDRGCC